MGISGLTKEQRNMVAVLLLGAVLVVLNHTMLSPAIPPIKYDTGVTDEVAQWLTTVYSLVEAIVIPLAAWFMGRFKNKNLFMGGMALFGLGSLVAAVAPNFWIILVGRALQAMSTGVLMVMVMALILLSFPRESRGSAMGLVNLVICFAPAIGPTLGGMLATFMGWRMLFVVVAVASLLVVVLAYFALKDGVDFPNTPLDPVSVIFSVSGLFLLLLGFSLFGPESMHIALPSIIVGAILTGIFVWRQSKLDEPMLCLDVLKSRRYRVAFVVIGCVQAVIIGLGTLLMYYIQNVLGFSSAVSGLVTLPGAIVGAIAALVAGRMFDARGVRGVALIGGVLTVVGAFGMIFFGVETAIVFVAITYLVSYVGVEMLFTPVNTWGVNSLENSRVQHATATSNTMNQVCGALGTAFIIAVSSFGSSYAAGLGLVDVEQTATGYHFSFIVVLALSLIIMFVVLFGVRNKKSDKPVRSTQTRDMVLGRGLTVSDVMDSNPVTVHADAPLSEAVRALASSGQSGVVLTSDQGVVKGFLSNSDVLRFFGDEMQSVAGPAGFVALRQPDDEGVIERAEHLSHMKSIELATKHVVGVEPSMPFEEACAMLASKRLKELPVIEDEKLVGVMRRSTLMRLVAGIFDQGQQRSETLRNGS